MSYKFSKHKFDTLKHLSSTVYDERILSNWQYVLRELPNVKDEVSGSQKIQRVKEYTLQSSDITLDTVYTYTNLDYFRVPKPLDYIYLTSGTVGKTSGSFRHGTFSEYFGGTFDSADNVGKVTAVAIASYFWFGFAKGTTLAAAQAALMGTKLTYQLAEPIVTPLPDDLDPQTYELARQSELLDKAINAIITLGGTIV